MKCLPPTFNKTQSRFESDEIGRESILVTEIVSPFFELRNYHLSTYYQKKNKKG